MAVETHAAASTQAPLPEPIEHAHPHATDAGGEDTDREPAPASVACGVARPAASPNGAPDLAGPVADGLPSLTLAVPRASLNEGGWVEATWPPGTRRALLQVYRI